jgi:PDZ domain
VFVRSFLPGHDSLIDSPPRIPSSTVVFLENECGCDVAKVDQQGSAARSGGVKVGDQLAAVNRTSSFGMKVEEICDLVMKAPSSQSVELMFVRYIGPLIPNQKQPRSIASSVGHDMDTTSAGMEVEYKKMNAAAPRGKPLRRVFRMFGRGKNKS